MAGIHIWQSPGHIRLGFVVNTLDIIQTLLSPAPVRLFNTILSLANAKRVVVQNLLVQKSDNFVSSMYLWPKASLAPMMNQFQRMKILVQSFFLHIQLEEL